ncbi:hypothetical protein ACET9K_08305 [Aeromonas enteropelogenes]|uniref:hypothetical protein n=1 Tax=Aeromonas enteropelogenes TaxID=29489 RepID=UPI0038D208FE
MNLNKTQLAVVISSTLLVSAAHAIMSESTPKVVGHKPVASGVTLSPTAPKARESVTASWTYADDDNDIESGSGIEWLLDDVVIGQGESFILPRDSAGKSLQVRVTPRSASPADPVEGESVNSPGVVIEVNNLLACTPGETLSNEGLTFTCPPSTTMNWSSADSYCKGQGARLPTLDELRSLHRSKTLGRSKYSMCTEYGWPMHGGLCGGSRNTYFTSGIFSNTGQYIILYMQTGISSGSDDIGLHQVTCVL